MTTLGNFPRGPVAEVSPEVYVLVCKYDGSWESGGDMKWKKNLGCFATLEHAEAAVRRFIKYKAREVECTQKVEYQTHWAEELSRNQQSPMQQKQPPANSSGSFKITDHKGTTTWGVGGDYSQQYYHVKTKKYPIYQDDWPMKVSELPVVKTTSHQKKCRCSEESDEEEFMATIDDDAEEEEVTDENEDEDEDEMHEDGEGVDEDEEGMESESAEKSNMEE